MDRTCPCLGCLFDPFLLYLSESVVSVFLLECVGSSQRVAPVDEASFQLAIRVAGPLCIYFVFAIDVWQ
jgi:hypothetical protein